MRLHWAIGTWNMHLWTVDVMSSCRVAEKDPVACNKKRNKVKLLVNGTNTVSFIRDYMRRIPAEFLMIYSFYGYRKLQFANLLHVFKLFIINLGIMGSSF